MAKIVYILLYSFMVFTSANADWKMIDTREGVFIYESEKGIFLKYCDQNISKPHFKIIPLKTDKYIISGNDLTKTIHQ